MKIMAFAGNRIWVESFTSKTIGLLVVLVMILVGCSSPSKNSTGDSKEEHLSSKRPSPKRTLLVTIVDNAALVEELTLQYKANFEREVKITSIDQETFNSRVDSNSLKSDVLIYPAWLLPKLASKGQIREMAKDRLRSVGNSKWLRAEQKVGSWNKQVWGLSLGCQFGVLIGRDSASDNEIFNEDQLSFQSLSKNREMVFFPKTGDTKNDSLIQSFLFQSIPFSWSRTQIDPLFNRFDVSPKINSPAFVSAAKEIQKRLKKDNITNEEKSIRWWKSSRFQAGWVNPFEIVDKGDRLGKLWRILPLPRSHKIYDEFQKKWVEIKGAEGRPAILFPGMVVSVNKDSKNERSSWKFLEMFSKPKTADRIAMKLDRPAIYLASQSSRLDKILDRTVIGPIASRLEETYRKLESEIDYVPILVPRIPSWPKLKEELSDCLQSIDKDNKSPEDALNSCSERWVNIIKKDRKLTMDILSNQD